MHEFFRDRMRHFHFGAAGHTLARLKNAQIFASSAVFTRRSVTTTGAFAVTAIKRTRTKAATLTSTVTHDFTHFTIKKDTNLVEYKRASRHLRHKVKSLNLTLLTSTRKPAGTATIGRIVAVRTAARLAFGTHFGISIESYVFIERITARYDVIPVDLVHVTQSRVVLNDDFAVLNFCFSDTKKYFLIFLMLNSLTLN